MSGNFLITLLFGLNEYPKECYQITHIRLPLYCLSKETRISSWFVSWLSILLLLLLLLLILILIYPIRYYIILNAIFASVDWFSFAASFIEDPIEFQAICNFFLMQPKEPYIYGPVGRLVDWTMNRALRIHPTPQQRVLRLTERDISMQERILSIFKSAPPPRYHWWEIH